MIVRELNSQLLPPNHPIVHRVRRVAERILEANDLGTLKTVRHLGGDMQARDVVFGSEMAGGGESLMVIGRRV